MRLWFSIPNWPVRLFFVEFPIEMRIERSYKGYFVSIAAIVTLSLAMDSLADTLWELVIFRLYTPVYEVEF